MSIKNWVLETFFSKELSEIKKDADDDAIERESSRMLSHLAETESETSVDSPSTSFSIEIDEFGCERINGEKFTISPTSEKYVVEPVSHSLIPYSLVEQCIKNSKDFKKKHKLTEDFSEAAVSNEILRDFIGFYGGSLANNSYFEWNFQKQRLMIERSHEECQKGIGKAIKDITTNFVLGDGIGFEYSDIKVEDPVVRDQLYSTLWKIWQDNKFDQKQYTISDFAVERGEVFIKISEDKSQGIFDVEVIDPWEITDYLYDPKTRKVKAWFRDYYRNGEQQIGEPLLVEGGVDQHTNIPYTMHHYKFNVSDTIIRGRSDIYSVLYWIKIYNDFLKCRSRVNRFRSSVAWHKTIAGGTRAISAGTTKVQKPFPPGTVLVTDDKTEYKAIEAKIQAGDVKDDGDSFKIIIASAIQIPHHWLFGSGENTNLATAKNMSAVPKRKFLRRQKELKSIFQDIFWKGLKFFLDSSEKTPSKTVPLTEGMNLTQIKEAIVNYSSNKIIDNDIKEDQFKLGKDIIKKKHLEISIPNIDEHNSEDLLRLVNAVKGLRDAGIGSNHALYEMVGINYRKDQELLEREFTRGDFEVIRQLKRIFNKFDPEAGGQESPQEVLDKNKDGVVSDNEQPEVQTDQLDDSVSLSKSARGGA